MSKATPQDLMNAGFKPEQFSKPADWDVEGGFLQTILDDVALEVENTVGITRYADAAADGTAGEKLDLKRIKRAETELASAELWRRREQFDNAVARVNNSGGEQPTIGSRMLKNAEEAEARAWAELAKMTGDYSGSAIAASGVETDHWSVPA